MLKAVRKAALLGAEGKAVSVTEMAEQLPSVQSSEAARPKSDHVNGRTGRMAEGKHVSSMREGRSKPHKPRTDRSSKSGHKRMRKHGAQ